MGAEARCPDRWRPSAVTVNRQASLPPTSDLTPLRLRSNAEVPRTDVLDTRERPSVEAPITEDRLTLSGSGARSGQSTSSGTTMGGISAGRMGAWTGMISVLLGCSGSDIV